MHDVENCRQSFSGEGDSHPRDIIAAKYMNGGTPDLFIAAAAFAIQKALHKRQESYEFLVMSFLEFGRIAAELVYHFVPNRISACRVQAFPMVLNLRAFITRQ